MNELSEIQILDAGIRETGEKFHNDSIFPISVKAIEDTTQTISSSTFIDIPADSGDMEFDFVLDVPTKVFIVVVGAFTTSTDFVRARLKMVVNSVDISPELFLFFPGPLGEGLTPGNVFSTHYIPELPVGSNNIKIQARVLTAMEGGAGGSITFNNTQFKVIGLSIIS